MRMLTLRLLTMRMKMLKMFKAGLVLGLVFCFTFISNQSVVMANARDFTDVEAFFDQLFNEKMSEHHIPNAVISVVADGEVILEKGYGFADIENQLPVDPKQSLFRIGSTSKLFTWTAVMQLVEQGILDLHTDVNEYLDFEIPAQLVTLKNVKPEPITLTHLMTHTPGFEDYPDSLFRLEPTEFVPFSSYVQNNLPARVYPPGEVVAYSNYGTALAGYIVEQVSGMPFAQYIEQNIYEPLGMKHSTFRQPLPDELSSHMTGAYRYVDGEFLPAQFVFMPEAAGGMSSTASDMAQFMLAYLQNGQVDGGRMLTEETVQLMRNQQFTVHPELNGMAYGFMEGTFNGQHTIFHSGSTMLFDTGFYLLPEEQVGIFISYSGGSFLIHQNMFYAFLDKYYPDSSEQIQLLPPDGTKDRSKQYVGEYHQNRKNFTTSEKLIKLMMGTIQVTWDDEGYLLVNHLGETSRFVEAEPGVYRNTSKEALDPFGKFETIIFEQDPLGHTILLSDGPLSYSKAPWYSTSSFTFLTLIASLLFVIGSFIYRGIAGGVRLVLRRVPEQSKQAKQTKLATSARWFMMIYSMLALLFVIDVASASEFDPVYGFVKSAFGVLPSWAPIFEMIPLLMILCSVGIFIFMIVSWWKRFWTITGRLHYTFFTVFSLILTWLFSFWNLV